MGADRYHDQIQLGEGRLLGLCEVGDPAGIPIFYFHGFPGSRLEVRFLGAVAERLGLRIIGVDRPGCGLSDFQPNREIGDWPGDVERLADALNIGRFGVVGVSGGGPYAAACARMIPDRLSFVGIVCGLGPTEAPGALSGMTLHNRVGLRTARRAPWLARAAFWPLTFCLRFFPGYVVKTMSRHLGEPDRTALRQPEIAHTLEASFRDSVLQGFRGPFRDLILYTRPWGFYLQEIEVKVHLWHGDRDGLVPPSMGHYMEKRIPQCEATFFPDEGHFSLITRHHLEMLRTLSNQVSPTL